jgi:hypothetical protein
LKNWAAYPLEIRPSLYRPTTDDSGVPRSVARAASALRMPHAPFLRPALAGTAVDAAPGIHWRSWEKLVPTKNQPELAITAVESERIASMSPLVAAARGRSREPRTATLQPFCAESLGSSRRPRPAVAHHRVRLSATAAYTVRLVHIQSYICDIAHSPIRPVTHT